MFLAGLTGPCPWLVLAALYISLGRISQSELVLTLPGRDLTGRGLTLDLSNTGPNLEGPWTSLVRPVLALAGLILVESWS